MSAHSISSIVPTPAAGGCAPAGGHASTAARGAGAGCPGASVISGGRSATSITSPGAITIRFSSVLRSSRMFPGQR